jgi:hypothetical protein
LVADSESHQGREPDLGHWTRAEIGGKYCENCHVGKVVADDVVISAISEGVRVYALDPANAAALWKKSEEMVGESF